MNAFCLTIFILGMIEVVYVIGSLASGHVPKRTPKTMAVNAFTWLVISGWAGVLWLTR